MKRFIIILITLFTIPVFGQQSISLQECYDLVASNYPLAKQSQLLEEQNNLDLEILSKGKLPQLAFAAQATYQSDVIEVPIPNSTIEPLNKDQYRTTLSVNQLIYNGGRIHSASELKSAQLKTQQKQVEVTLYQLEQQVNQLYFSILLTQEKHKVLVDKQAQLQSKIKEVQSGIKYGAVLPASDKVLEAELLKIEQQFTEIDNDKSSLIETLSALIGQSLENETNFQMPIVETTFQGNINRPELELFQLKKEEIESSENLISKENSPKLLGFATGGYGNPGLNMLDNSFQPFYTVGVKLNWNVFDWNANKKQRESLVINKDIIDNETEVFNLNTNIALNQQHKEIAKLEALLLSDIKIIELRKTILQTADSQLKNGVITSSDYIVELTNLYEDESSFATHNIQLQLAKANYNSIKGH